MHLGKYKIMRLIAAITICMMLGLPTAGSAYVVRQDDSNLARETGCPLYIWRDPAVHQPGAIIIAVHGSAQEGAVMDGLARVLVPQGMAVVAPDVRGNGRWQRMKTSSEMANMQLSDSCTDVSRILVILNKDYPGTDIFCLGESIGAGVVLKAVSENPRSVRGVILISAGVRPHMHNPLNMGTPFIKSMAMLVEPTDLKDYISRYCSEDPRVVHEMLNDPLGKNRQSGLDLIGTFAFLRQEPQFAAAMPNNIPVLAIQGMEDQIVEPSSVNDLLNALRTPEKHLVMVPGCGHVIVGTSFLKPQVVSCIEGWIQQHRSPTEPLPTNINASGATDPNDSDRGLLNPADYSQSVIQDNAHRVH